MSLVANNNPDATALHNAVSSEALHAFFDAKEQFFYYRQFNNPSRRRDFATSFIAAIEHFLDVSTGSLEAIYESYVRPPAKQSEDVMHLPALEKEWGRFPEFFDAASVVDLSSAKSAYRRAARILHPDIGGNAADMVALNACFAKLHEFLMLSETDATLHPDSSLEGGSRDDIGRDSSFVCGPVGRGFWPGSVLQYPRSTREFEILLRTEALLAATDIFDEDRHSELALGLAFNPNWTVTANSSWESFEKANASEKIADIIRIVLEAKRTDLPDSLPNLRELGQVWAGAAIDAWIQHGRLDAKENSSTKRLKALEEKALANGRYPFVDEWREKRLRVLVQRIDRPGSRADSRFQLNHSIQAENAFRRGLISPARYKKTAARLNEKREAMAAADAAIVEFVDEVGFMALEHDPVEASKAVSVRFVPESNTGSAFGNWKFESKQACRAYGEAYYRSEQVEGKLKFIRQRLWILLSSLVAHSDRWDKSRILAAAREIGLLEEAASAAREGQADQHAADLKKFLLELASEPAGEREGRLRILCELAREDFRDQLPEGVEATSKGVPLCGRFEYGSPLMQVVPSSDYYRSALRSIDELSAFCAGKSWSDPEREAAQDGIRYYYDHMQKLSDKMFNAADIEPAKKKVARLAPLIRQAIDQAVPLNAAGEWQLGYYMDRLTGAMVRDRQFSEAVAALQEYFALPDAYRRRSTPSEEKRLRARMARCDRDVARGISE